MADPNEPVPSAPPAEPFDVRVQPSGPPREPFNVEVTPSPPPAEPFDVPIYPDAPPASPFDVAVSPDGPPFPVRDVPTTPDRPPASPIDVPVAPDAPPGAPFDVPTAPDGPPREPTDVPIVPDAPPRAPVDVPVTPDAPPGEPVDVPTTPDAPPGAPFDVPTEPDAAPATPFDVAVAPDAPPAMPFDVPVYPDPPALQIPGNPGETPTIDQIVGAVVRFDRTLGAFLASIVEIQPAQAGGPGGAALDPTALARWLADYTRTVGQAGLARFLSEQAVLYAMNPVTARIFDPTYFLKMLVPGSMGHARTAVDVEAGVTMSTVARVRDELLAARVSANPERPGGDGLSDRPDAYGPENRYSDGQAYSVDSIVDSAIDGAAALSDSPFMAKRDGIARFDASAFFEPRDSSGGQAVRATAKARAGLGTENVSSTRLARSAAIDGVIRVEIPGEGVDGSVISQTQDPSDVVDDDDARVPLVFTDLRQVPGKRYRSVYFRPTNLQFSEAISPEFAEGSAFGRVDPTVGWQRTSRSITVAFEVHAFAPEDLSRMYNKMTWLKSMCYPTFGADSLVQSGPVVRMRIGDAVGTDLGGLPGVIRSLNFDFADAMWELKRGMKVPKSFKVSLDFLVLHDGPVGTVGGVFGVYQLPAGGPAPTKDTNFAGNPNDSRTEDAQGVTLLPGRFTRFGEPRS